MHNFYHKIYPNTSIAKKLTKDHKYSSKVKAINHKTLNNNFNSLDNNISDCISLNKNNYSATNDYNPILFMRKKPNKSNNLLSKKLTYVLTTNESSNFEDKNSISQKLMMKKDFFKYFKDNTNNNNLTTETDKSKNYEQKYLETYQSYAGNDKEKRAFSNNLKKYRENLNNIVKILNVTNNINKKEMN